MSLKPITEVTREGFLDWYMQFSKSDLPTRMKQMKTVFEFCEDREGQEFSMIPIAENGGMRVGTDVAKILFGYVLTK